MHVGKWKSVAGTDNYTRTCDLCGETMSPPAGDENSTDSNENAAGCNATLGGSTVALVALTLSAAWLTLRKKKI